MNIKEEKKEIEKLRKIWIENLELYISGKINFVSIDSIANNLYTDVSVASPKVDDVFFASLEYFIDLESSKKKITKEKIDNDIKKILEVLKKRNKGIVTELKDIG